MQAIKGYFNPQKEGDTFKGLNSTIDGEVSSRIIQNLPEFLKSAGRDYFIKKAKVYQACGDTFAEVENQYHLVRSTDERVVSPHTVTDQYAPLSLVDIADELQPWCDQGWATPDAVFSGRNESLELLVLRLDAGGNLPNGEKFKHYAAFQNPHGVGGTSKGKIFDFRVICGNTFAAAISHVSDFVITHRIAAGDHEKQQEIMGQRAKDAVNAWTAVQNHIKELADKINTWSSVKVSAKDAAAMTDKLLGIPDLSKASTRAKNRREAILQGFNMPQFGTRGETAYDWLNAVTFVNSSPFAEINSAKNSKVSGIDRTIRNLDPNGSGFKVEQNAEKVLASMVG